MNEEQANETLIVAARTGNIELLKVVIAAGADINYMGCHVDPDDYDEVYDKTALTHAVMHKQEECVKLLLAAGALPVAFAMGSSYLTSTVVAMPRASVAVM